MFVLVVCFTGDQYFMLGDDITIITSDRQKASCIPAILLVLPTAACYSTSLWQQWLLAILVASTCVFASSFNHAM